MAISLRSLYSAATPAALKARLLDQPHDRRAEPDVDAEQLSEQLQTAIAVALAVTMVAGIAMLMGMT